MNFRAFADLFAEPIFCGISHLWYKSYNDVKRVKLRMREEYMAKISSEASDIP